MNVLDQVSFAGVFIAGAYLIALGIALIIARDRAARFMLGFATSFQTHVLEMFLRGLTGCALVLRAPSMRFPAGFEIFGWFLIASAAVLILTPWRYHRRFAEAVVPQALSYGGLFGACSVLFGVFVLYALIK